MIRALRSSGAGQVLLTAFTAAMLAAFGLGVPTEARAEPAFAVRTGYSCGQCHVNHSGGGMRTAFGSIYTQMTLPSQLLPWQEVAALIPTDPQARFAFGADLYAGFYRADFKDAPDTATFDVPAANVYGQIRFIRDRLSLYVDQRVGTGGSTSRELFGLLSLPEWHSYVKVGRILVPYGWALPDDAAFIREPLGFSFSSSDIGAEVGFEPPNWSAQLAVVNGSSGGRDTDRGKKVTFLGTRRFGWSRLGLSAAADFAPATTTTWAGLLGGMNFGRLGLLAEADIRNRQPDKGQSTETWVGFFEADLLIVRGLSLKYAHDWIDPSRDVRSDQKQRDSLGIEYFPIPFVQLRAFVRRSDGPPQVPGARNWQTDLEIHLFL